MLTVLYDYFVSLGSRPRIRPGWAVGNSEIHISLSLTLFILSFSTLAISFLPGYSEFRPVSVTLPLIWLGSLIVRLAAQQLSIGDFSHDFDTTICPAGNIQTDYEYLPPRAILAYATSGQLASVGMMSVALVVNAAMTPTPTDTITLNELFDFQGGWHSLAWATQIFWVNLFLVVLHFLPTVPFDMRALIFSAYSWRSRTALEPHVFRGIATLNSHLATLLMGIGLAAFIAGWLIESPIDIWYAFVAASVYLFVASRWEKARAEELEEQYVPTPTRMMVGKAVTTVGGPHFEIPPPATEVEEEFDPVDLIAQGSQADGEDFTDSAEYDADEEGLDVDEILRKVHRDGFSALSDDEQQALLWASKEIQEKRQSRS